MKYWYLVALLLAGASVGCSKNDIPEKSLAWVRTETQTVPEIGNRRRLAKTPFMYSEFLIKYGMFQNYLHYWIDRPLFWNRTTRPEKFEYENAASVGIHARQLQKAGLNGFNVFVQPNKTRFFGDLNRWFAAAGAGELNILPTVSYGEAVDRSGPKVKAFADAVRMVQADARSTRINGKVLVSTYNYRLFTAEQHRQFMAELKAELGNEDFILCGDIPFQLLRRLQQSFQKSGCLTAAEISELEHGIRGVLDIAGGIQVSATELIRNPRGQYCSYYDTKFFDTYTGPLLEKLLTLPEYREKVLGFYIHQGYVNHFTGHDHSEEGTCTLRRDLQSAVRLNPDYLVFFEWNEVNENTMFQPTVWGGQVACRILHYYSRVLKGLPPTPYDGDDPAVPPVVLTYRAMAKAGELLHFEILTIPDGVWTKPVKAQLELADPEGNAVARFPVDTLDPTQLGSVDYRLSTARLRGDAVLVPTLVVDGKRYDGFSPIRIDPTVCCNYKTVRHALRERLAPAKVSAQVTSAGNGKYDFDLRAEFPEKLASLELIENENEMSAAGSEAEYDFSSNVVLRLAFTVPRSGSVASADMTISVEGAKGCKFAPLWRANVNQGRAIPLKDGSGVRVLVGLWSQETAWYVQVPKTAVADARLKVVIKGQEFVPAEFSVAQLVKQGAASRVIRPETSHRLDVRRVFDLPDLPMPLNKQQVSWQGSVETRTRRPVFHFRAISETGKLWRSRPLVPSPATGDEVEIPVWDDLAERPTVVSVPKAMLPVLDYRFDPSAGAVLLNRWDPGFDAYLGGGFYYSEAFSEIDKGRIASGCRAPEWVRDGNDWCLKFDGANDYVNFPREALPNAAFGLAMTLKPEYESGRTMVLFRHFSWIRGSISLYIVNGRLVARWGDRDLTREPTFETGLEIRNGEWNDISVTYDYARFVFTVNGVSREFPWEGRAWAFKPAIFGGHDKQELAPGKEKPVYFKGLLKRLSIWHGAAH